MPTRGNDNDTVLGVRKKCRAVSIAVRAYFSSLPADSRRELKKLPAAIRAAAPGAIEGPSYGILGFKLDGKVDHRKQYLPFKESGWAT